MSQFSSCLVFSFVDVGSPDGGRSRRQGRGDLDQKVCRAAASGMNTSGQGCSEDLWPGGGLGGGGRLWLESRVVSTKNSELDR